MLEKLIVTMESGGFVEDGSRFRVVRILQSGSGACRSVVSIGGWLSLKRAQTR
jgi:hypothetical protein